VSVSATEPCGSSVSAEGPRRSSAMVKLSTGRDPFPPHHWDQPGNGTIASLGASWRDHRTRDLSLDGGPLSRGDRGLSTSLSVGAPPGSATAGTCHGWRNCCRD